jgi:hypothetical protein
MHECPDCGFICDCDCDDLWHAWPEDEVRACRCGCWLHDEVGVTDRAYDNGDGDDDED